jgi:hypothetical protein
MQTHPAQQSVSLSHFPYWPLQASLRGGRGVIFLRCSRWLVHLIGKGVSAALWQLNAAPPPKQEIPVASAVTSRMNPRDGIIELTMFRADPVKGTNDPLVPERSMRIFALLIGLLLVSTSLQAQNYHPTGPAGQDVDVTYDGSCYWASNRSSHKVTVKLGPFSAVLNPGERHRFINPLSGSCFSGFMGPTEASYVPEPAPAPVAAPRPPQPAPPVEASRPISPPPPPADPLTLETDVRELHVVSCIASYVYLVWIGEDGVLMGPAMTAARSPNDGVFGTDGLYVMSPGSGGRLATTGHRTVWAFAQDGLRSRDNGYPYDTDVAGDTIVGGDLSPKDTDRIFKLSDYDQKHYKMPAAPRFSAIQLKDVTTTKWKPGLKIWRADLACN